MFYNQCLLHFVFVVVLVLCLLLWSFCCPVVLPASIMFVICGLSWVPWYVCLSKGFVCYPWNAWICHHLIGISGFVPMLVCVDTCMLAFLINNMPVLVNCFLYDLLLWFVALYYYSAMGPWSAIIMLYIYCSPESRLLVSSLCISAHLFSWYLSLCNLCT